MKGRIRDQIRAFFFPKRCLFCDTVMACDHEPVLCRVCAPQGYFLTAHLCACCGKPLNNPKDILCFDCSKKPHQFDEGRAMWTYSQGVREAITRYKYSGRRALSEAFAKMLYRFYLEAVMNRWDVDLIVPVPLHPKKLRSRGFNQAEDVAKKLGSHLGIPVENLLKRSKNTRPQKDLTDGERILNIKDAFEIGRAAALSGRTILLVDDIYTTGSTMDACAGVLKAHGAKRVYCLTIAIGKGF